MSAPYHTSGPWVLGREIGGYVDIDAPHALVKWTALARVVIETEAVNGYTRNAEAEANARLIAAAPELLEAAEGLASDVQCLVDCRADCGEWGAECPLQDAHKPDGTIERLQRLLDAIAKARGGAA